MKNIDMPISPAMLQALQKHEAAKLKRLENNLGSCHFLFALMPLAAPGLLLIAAGLSGLLGLIGGVILCAKGRGLMGIAHIFLLPLLVLLVGAFAAAAGGVFWAAVMNGSISHSLLQ